MRPRSQARSLDVALECALVAVVIAAIGWIDYVTGKDISFALIYLVPIVAAAWWGSRAAAWTSVAIASAVGIAADAGFSVVSPYVLMWNRASRLAIFAGAVIAVRTFRMAREREREEAIEALRASEARFRGLVESTSDWVWELDALGRYSYSSPKSFDLLGYQPHELLGRHPVDLMPPAEAERVRTELQPLFDARKPLISRESVSAHKDGRLVVLETSGVPLFDSLGAFLGYRGIDRDVSERKRADAHRQQLTEQLNQASRLEAIGRLAGGVAHEFNNLLTVILGSTEFLLDRLRPGDPSEADAREIRKAGERARQLTRQLLAFGRRQMLQPKPIDLNVIILGMESLLRRVMREDVRFKTVLVSGVAAVHADPAEIEKVITNLVANARDAMPHGGTLTIRTAFLVVDPGGTGQIAPGPYVTMAVQDTGVGMDATSQAHVFEPFYTTKDLVQGGGLGLATVRGIVEQSGGHVQVESALGRGTTFTVLLPRLNADMVLVRPRGGETAAAGRGTVLVVEDEATVRALLARFLEAEGFAVIAANGPQEALRLAAESHFDLVVADVIMPDMNGPELVTRLHAIKPSARVLYVSGYPDTALTQHGVFASGAPFLQKPFARETLGAKVREALQQDQPRGLISDR